MGERFCATLAEYQPDSPGKYRWFSAADDEYAEMAVPRPAS